ncbi:hypothetical protein KIN20_026438 [Parelaphostrongylus tenuis]|uniref:Uncharacterized protein n=1 Tax=Parelaphostrongylus tenuis TaxID=148309 RepID=A0AAD5QY17_PARTN|nr:hypothetical protein KIN20_026438 [Parelaphostrongylus tenuis]
MKRLSENAETALVSRKCIKLNREELESADTATLIEKLISLTDQLNERNEMVRMWKTRLALARLQVLQIDKELKDVLKERNDAYYERIGRREKEITELRDAVKALESGKDCKILYEFLASKKNLVKNALCAIRKEKKDYAQEISERDAKIAELEKELYQYRRYVIEQVASEHTELDRKRIRNPMLLVRSRSCSRKKKKVGS